MSSTASLPSNVHVSRHPCLRAKLSQLRSRTTNARETKMLVHEIALILGAEALAGLEIVQIKEDTTPIDFTYAVDELAIPSSRITLVPILRSGLGMLDALQTILPEPVSVHHLGLFREKISLQPVEYYNNLPYSSSSEKVAKLAILVDPVIATGGTAEAAIQTLREWGVEKIIVVSVLGAVEGVTRAAGEWPEGTEVWLGGLDDQLSDKGMINPGVGDIGDRLFLTLGK